MKKVSRNAPCPCGSGKKYKKCCSDKKPREQIILVGSPVPLKSFHYDKEKMEFMGLDHNGNLIKPVRTFSQTQYHGQTGKEKIISRIPDKVIPRMDDLMRYLSSGFDVIFAIDTNTNVIQNQNISVSSLIHATMVETSISGSYEISTWKDGFFVFKNCPPHIPAEKNGWHIALNSINSNSVNRERRFALVTDHDIENHNNYNNRKQPIVREFYLPENFTLLYARGDSGNDSILNMLLKECDKNSSKILSQFEEKGFYEEKGYKIGIDQIPECVGL
jgi:hypothetical protein